MRLAAFNLAAILVVGSLVALAAWQVHRRTWKLDLIARVDARVHAAPSPAPGRDQWAGISAAADEYRRVTMTGSWLLDHTTLVRAVTELGGGLWVMTPFARDDGTMVIVNRGFVPANKRNSASWTAPVSSPLRVTGLLRLSEPGGGFLRSNDPDADRWYSRDIEAIAASRRLAIFAPYFVDAEREPGTAGLPVGGLTVLSFTNNHIAYSITWSLLALMCAAGAVFVNIEAVRSVRKLASMSASERTSD